MTQVETVPDTRAELEAIEAELARRSLKRFVFAAWRILEPDTPLVWNWHLDELCDVLENVAAGRLKRVVINVPPGTMKSLLVSVFFPAWVWAKQPAKRFLTTSYGDRIAQRDTMKMRDLITSPWYKRVYGMTLKADQSMKTWFINAAGGWRIMGTPKGQGTGEHPDFLIIDDPHKAADAKSELALEGVRDWFSRTISSRGATRGTAIILIMQRLAEDDLAGYLLDAHEGWEHVMFPMRYEAKRADPRDHRSKEGELLWPALFPEPMVRTLELDLGPYGCTPAEAPVTMADLTHKPISQVHVGDDVIGFEKRVRTDGKNGRLKLRPSRVLAVNTYTAPVVKMTLDSGEVIRCTADHKWFTRTRCGERPDYLPATVGRSRLVRVCPAQLPPLSPEDERLAGWLSGFFDGDGTVALCRKNVAGDYRESASIRFYQGSGRNLPLCEKLESALQHFGFDFTVREDDRKPNKNAPCYGYRTYTLLHNDLPLYQRFLHIVQPTKWRARVVRGAYGAKFVKGRERVMSSEPDGTETVYALTTETGNYVVWGLASSNSAGQLQQRPAPEGGGLFQPRKWCKIIDGDSIPADVIWARGWDTAATENDGDFTVGTKMGFSPSLAKFIVADVRRGQWSPKTVDDEMARAAKDDGLACRIREEQEPGASGKSVIANRGILLRQFDYIGKPVSKDKEVRARPLRAAMERGDVWVVRAAWNEAWFREFEVFNKGKHDDQVDSGSCAYNELANEGRVDTVSVIWR